MKIWVTGIQGSKRRRNNLRRQLLTNSNGKTFSLRAKNTIRSHTHETEIYDVSINNGRSSIIFRHKVLNHDDEIFLFQVEGTFLFVRLPRNDSSISSLCFYSNQRKENIVEEGKKGLRLIFLSSTPRQSESPPKIQWPLSITRLWKKKVLSNFFANARERKRTLRKEGTAESFF